MNKSPKAIRGKRAGGAFGLKAWEFDLGGMMQEVNDKLNKIIGTAIDKTLQVSVKEYPPEVFFSPTRNDPSRMEIELPLGESNFEGPKWYFSLAEVVDRHLEFVDEEYPCTPEEMKRLAARMRKIADKIDARLKTFAAVPPSET